MMRSLVGRQLAAAARAVRIARTSIALACLPACVFCPNIEQYDYIPCESDGDCAAVRVCSETPQGKLCTPPPWNDTKLGKRQALVIENKSDVTIAKGTAVPVLVGAGGLLALDDVGADGRFTYYPPGKGSDGTWKIVPVYRDLENDRYTTWIPLSAALKKKDTAVLAWVESGSESGDPTINEDPTNVFRVFDSFNGEALDARWNVTANGGGGPRVEGGALNVADNQALVFTEALVPPIAATFVMRVNGLDCDEVFVGVVGNDDAIFNDGPSAGLFVGNNLTSSFQVAPTAASVPLAVGDAVDVGTSFMRVTVAVDRDRVHLVIDDGETHTDVGENALDVSFDDTPVFLALQVGGACSIDVDALWETPLPSPAPSVKAEPAIQLKLLF